MSNNYKLNQKATTNFKKVKLGLLTPAILVLVLLSFFLISKEGNYIDTYIKVQKDCFFYLNNKLSIFPTIPFNLTQLGDVLIVFPLLMALFIYAPKFWEALITSSLLSLVVSFGLKKLLAVPRPARVFDHDSFMIIGRTLSGKNSLPSGHSMTAFIVITILLFAFMPKKNISKVLWSFSIVTLGFVIAFSRVAVGAHYPLDVIAGSSIGYILAIIGIWITNNSKWLSWIENKKYYLIFIVLFTIWAFIIIKKIVDYNLLVFYGSLLSLIITLYLLIKSLWAKRN